MEQKNYNIDIVERLSKRHIHARELAKLVGTNHTTILRKIKELREMNIIDYKTEGKNNVCFLKESVEARNFIFIVEHYKLLRALTKYSVLRKVIENIQKNNCIDLAILFGSYAKGLAKKDSDIDLFVESKERNIKREVEQLDSRLSVKIGEFNKDNLLVKEIIANHIIIKGVEKFYERTKFFEKNR